MSTQKNLNKFLEELIQEVEKDLDEATASANVAGYNTPGAFSDGGSKDKKRKKKISTQFGMKIVGKMDEDLNEGYGSFIKAKNLTDIVALSKKKKNATFYVTDDNNSRIGTFYLKNGKFAKATSANPNYDFQSNKTKLKDRSDVIYKYKVDESVKEATFRPNSGTMSGGTYNLDKRKYELKRDVKGVKIGDYTNVTLPKGTIIYNLPGGVFAHHRSLKSYEAGMNKYFNKPTFRGISIRREKNVILSIEKNSKILESVPQGYNPVVEDKKQIKDLVKKVKHEKLFYDVLDTMEKKYGKNKYRIWLEKSLKSFGVNSKHYDYRTNAGAEEKLYQLGK